VKYSVRHQTRYVYSDFASISHNRLHSLPRELPWQERSEPNLTIAPEPAFLNAQSDYFGNPVTFFTVQKPHKELDVVVMFEVDIQERLWPEQGQSWERATEKLRIPSGPESLNASQFRFDSTWVKRIPELTKYTKSSFPAGADLLESCINLCHRLHSDFEFDDEATDVATPLEVVFKKKRGVCQDFAHVAIAGLRGVGLAARYVSGYLRTIPPPGETRLQGADASHAWVSVWIPETGWVDFDPTNDCLVKQDHITLAWGRDYHDVCPLRGVVLGGGQQTVKVGVDVVPRDE
jgi:transglutaminase-like putative cysteine protease